MGAAGVEEEQARRRSGILHFVEHVVGVKRFVNVGAKFEPVFYRHEIVFSLLLDAVARVVEESHVVGVGLVAELLQGGAHVVVCSLIRLYYVEAEILQRG